MFPCWYCSQLPSLLLSSIAPTVSTLFVNRFSNKMLKKAAFCQEHFTDTFQFKSKELDPVSKKVLRVSNHRHNVWPLDLGMWEGLEPDDDTGKKLCRGTALNRLTMGGWAHEQQLPVWRIVIETVIGRKGGGIHYLYGDQASRAPLVWGWLFAGVIGPAAASGCCPHGSQISEGICSCLDWVKPYKKIAVRSMSRGSRKRQGILHTSATKVNFGMLRKCEIFSASRLFHIRVPRTLQQDAVINCASSQVCLLLALPVLNTLLAAQEVVRAKTITGPEKNLKQILMQNMEDEADRHKILQLADFLDKALVCQLLQP